MSDDVAVTMWLECLTIGQAARRVDPAASPALRDALRRAAREAGLRVRTAVLDDDVVVVARTDATPWDDDTVTMRRELTPPT